MANVIFTLVISGLSILVSIGSLVLVWKTSKIQKRIAAQDGQDRLAREES